ncbi:oxysterol-binding protein-related protein 6-like [Penaeus indicus]|uniref:oxysterol-binding protein-related protein 6-like n=1 Tax=Penaeus indicus TaxID=29960 RepID=UPI00300C160F
MGCQGSKEGEFENKASSWSSKRHEVFGTVTDSDGQVLHNLFGKWTEALYCGHAPSARVVWRPGSMPEDYHLYYGFTRFAIELNELDEDQAKYLPPTDTRFRPDQRLVEEGNMNAGGNHEDPTGAATKGKAQTARRSRG